MLLQLFLAHLCPCLLVTSRRKVWWAGHSIAELHKSSSKIINLLIWSHCIALSLASMKAALATYLLVYAYDWAAERRIWIVISSFTDDLTLSEQSSHQISEDGSANPTQSVWTKKESQWKHIWNSCNHEERIKWYSPQTKWFSCVYFDIKRFGLNGNVCGIVFGMSSILRCSFVCKWSAVSGCRILNMMILYLKLLKNRGGSFGRTEMFTNNCPWSWISFPY